MSGKRLLDVAAVFSASRAVASRHFALRREQLDVYSRTSSIAKAVRTQTDRTAQPAFAASQDLNGRGSSYSTQVGRPTPSGESDPVPSPKSVQAEGSAGGPREGIEQDHFYERSENNASADPAPQHDLGIKQEQANRHPLPDGTIPPQQSPLDNTAPVKEAYNKRPDAVPVKEPLQDSQGQDRQNLKPESSSRSSIPDLSSHTGGLTSEDAKRLQRQSEFQIPAKSAEMTPAASHEAEVEMHIDQDRDTFYTPSPDVAPVLSALPRTKVPKTTVNIQAGDEHIPEDINADVFYSSAGDVDQSGSRPIPSAQAEPSQEEPSEDMMKELFHSPKVSRLLSNKASSRYGKSEIRPESASTPIENANTGKDQDTFNVRTDDHSVKGKDTGSIEELGESIAQDAASSTESVRLSVDPRA